MVAGKIRWWRAIDGYVVTTIRQKDVVLNRVFLGRIAICVYAAGPETRNSIVVDYVRTKGVSVSRMEIYPLRSRCRTSRANQEVIENCTGRAATGNSVGAENETGRRRVREVSVYIIIVNIGPYDAAGRAAIRDNAVQVVSRTTSWIKPVSKIADIVAIDVNVTRSTNVHLPTVVGKRVVVEIYACGCLCTGACLGWSRHKRHLRGSRPNSDVSVIQCIIADLHVIVRAADEHVSCAKSPLGS